MISLQSEFQPTTWYFSTRSNLQIAKKISLLLHAYIRASTARGEFHAKFIPFRKHECLTPFQTIYVGNPCYVHSELIHRSHPNILLKKCRLQRIWLPSCHIRTSRIYGPSSKVSRTRLISPSRCPSSLLQAPR